MSDLKKFNQLMKLDYTQDYLSTVLGERRQSFVTSLTELVSNDKNLQQCEPETIMYAALTATAMNLPLNKSLGYAYVIPFKNNKTGTTEAQLQLGYKAYQQLAVRTKEYDVINATDVREGELKKINRLTGRYTFEWIDPEERNEKPIIGYAAIFQLKDGYSKTIFMTVEEMQAHATRYSQTYSSRNEFVRKNSKWSTDFDAMAKKTIIKKLLNDGTAPKSIEILDALKADQSVQREAGAYSYVDNDKETAKDALAERAKERATEDAEYSDDVAEHPEATATEPAKPIDPNVNDLPFED